jgi:hypothetical protein
VHTDLAAVAVMAVLAVTGAVFAVVVSLADRSRARFVEEPSAIGNPRTTTRPTSPIDDRVRPDRVPCPDGAGRFVRHSGHGMACARAS